MLNPRQPSIYLVYVNLMCANLVTVEYAYGFRDLYAVQRMTRLSCNLMVNVCVEMGQVEFEL